MGILVMVDDDEQSLGVPLIVGVGCRWPPIALRGLLLVAVVSLIEAVMILDMGSPLLGLG